MVSLKVCLMVNIAQSFLILYFSINCLFPLVTLGFPWLILFYFSVSCCYYIRWGKQLKRQDFLQNLNSSFPYVDTSAYIIKMGKSSTKILIFFESALNALKKSDLVQKILDLKGKIIVDTDLHKLSNQIHKPSEAISQISLENRKLTSELVITKNVNSRLEESIINLEKKQAKWKQYSRRNNVELSDIPNSIYDEDLENTVINIYKESGIDVDVRDI